MAEFPLVTVVTPSYNMARFIEETVGSVLDQDYPNLEYFVIDGGSTDGTVEILDRYRGRLRYVSEGDRGTSDALRKGFAQAKGDVLAYLCADDAYLPGAVRTAVDQLREHPAEAGVYGDAWWVDQEGNVLGPYPTQPFNLETLARECYICQPAAFFRREVYEELGGFDPALESAYDYDFWLRLSRRYTLAKLDVPLARSRMHAVNKTLGRRKQVFRESIRAVRTHTGYVPFQWTYGYTCFLIDGRDQFFQPLRPSIFKYLVSLVLGSWHNRGALTRYWREWFSVMSAGGFQRRWNEGWLARRLGPIFRQEGP